MEGVEKGNQKREDGLEKCSFYGHMARFFSSLDLSLQKVQKNKTNQIYLPQTCCNIQLVWNIYSVRLDDCSRMERKEESTVRVLPILRMDIRYQVRECQQKPHLYI